MVGCKVDFIFDLILSLIIYPLLAIFVILLWTYKQVVTTLGRLLKSRHLVGLEGCESLTGLEIFNGHSSGKEVAMRWNIGLVLRLRKGENVNITWLRRKFEKTFFNRLPSESAAFANLYTYLVTFGGYTFRDSVDKVDLERHIQEATIPSNQSIQEYLANLLESNYEAGTPFWKVLLIPAPDTNDEVLVVLKIHHALADGYTLIHMLDRLTDSQTPYKLKEFQDSLWHKLALKIRTPRLVWNLFRDASSEPPMFSVDSEEGQFFSFTTLNLEDMKQVRRMTDSKFDSVFISLLGGVARRIFLEGSTEDKLPKYTYISTTAPWPNHPCFCDAGETNRKMCNHWTIANTKVPLLRDPLKRLRAVDRNFKDSLEQTNRITRSFIVPLFGILPDCLKRTWANSVPFLQFTGTINMGSGQPLPWFLDQNEMTHIQPLAGCPFPSTAIMGACYSNSNRFECTMATRKSVAGTQSRSDTFCRDLDEELQILLQNLKKAVVPGTN